MNMVYESYEYGELPDSLKKAVLALLFKKGDPNLLSNYRPISLTNYDYKIIAFTLAKRLQKVIKKLVSKDQTAYIQNRFIGCNIRTICDIIENADIYNIPGLIVCLDFEKAFDTLEWDFLFKTLEKYNFGKNFIKWIKTLYTDPRIIVKNNGWMSREIEIKRGVRQGCPISALLFILCVEMLSIAIKDDKNIKGYVIDETELKVVQHADDSTLLLSSKESVKIAVRKIDEFTSVSGLKLNINKTEGIWIGTYKGSENIYEGISFKNEPIKCLGIYIGNDIKQCEQRNWQSKLNDFQKTLESWKTRKLSLFGKVQVVNSLAISKLVYNFSILPVSDERIKEIQKLVTNFIWNKKDRIKRLTVIGNKNQGGLGLVDIESKILSLKAAWVPRIFNSESSWTHFPKALAKDKGFNIEDFIRTNWALNKECVGMPQFYIDIFTAFHRCKTYHEVVCLNEFEFFNEPIWLNRRYMNKNACLYCKNWIQSGFIYVKDVFDNNGNFICEKECLQRLKQTNNWISEYSLVKKILMKTAKTLDTTIVNHVNMNKKLFFYFNDSFIKITDQKSKFFYKILVNVRFKKPDIQHFWAKQFNIENNYHIWKTIYENKVIAEKYKKFAEFNYKMLHNILPCGKLVNKWNKSVSARCVYCNEDETIKHIYYDCNRVNNIWRLLGKVLKMNIQWKHLVIGYIEESQITIFRNKIFTVILYSIFSQWVEFSEEPKKFRDLNLYTGIIKNLIFYNRVYKLTENHIMGKLYDTLLENL